jgi:hypothetical protein
MSEDGTEVRSRISTRGNVDRGGGLAGRSPLSASSRACRKDELRVMDPTTAMDPGQVDPRGGRVPPGYPDRR